MFAPILAITLIGLGILLALLALLLWLLKDQIFGGTPAPLPPAAIPPYPNPATATSTAAGGNILVQGSWSGVVRQQRGTSEDYTFLRQTYDIAAPGDPYAPAPNVAVRFRLVTAAGELASITTVTDGAAVTGADWWAAVTDADGNVVVTVAVGRGEQALLTTSTLEIVAEELNPDGTVARGVTHTVQVVPSGH